MSPPKVPTVKLINGKEIPIFGLGTWKSAAGEVNKTVQDAIDVGYRHIDCAMAYSNEHEVGAAIEAKIKQGVVKREDLFITSKLWNTYHRSDLVIKGCKKTLADLKLEYLDLFLVHWPMAFKEDGDLFPKNDKDEIIFSDVDYLDTWKQMEELVRVGLVKTIGLSNFNSQQIQRVLDNCSIKPALLQVEIHPYWNQTKLVDWCKSKGIAVTAYSPFGSPDRPWATANDPKLLDDPKLGELAKKYGKSPAQLVLRWLVQREIVTIPKTVNKNRLAENLNIFDFTLSDEDMAYMFTFNRPEGRALHLSWNKTHKYFPFSIEY